MKATFKTAKEYYASLPIDEAKKIAAKSFDVYMSHVDGDPCSGCTPTTPYGGCYWFSDVCTWIPEFGRE